MSGGVAYVLDVDGQFASRFNQRDGSRIAPLQEREPQASICVTSSGRHADWHRQPASLATPGGMGNQLVPLR